MVSSFATNLFPRRSRRGGLEMRSQSNVRSIAAGFLAAVLIVTLSSRPTMATPATAFPTGSPGYFFSDTLDGTTVGLTTTMGGGNNNYNTEPTGGAITGAIVDIAGVKTLITVNGAAEWYCWQTNAASWYDCKAALAGQGYECTYFATTAFYTRPTCSPTRTSPPPAASVLASSPLPLYPISCALTSQGRRRVRRRACRHRLQAIGSATPSLVQRLA